MTTVPTLREFFETRFVPEKVAGRKRKYEQAQLERTVDRFCDCLGRVDLPLDRLNAPNATAFETWLINSGFSSRSAANDRARLRSIWWHAFRLGLVAEAPKVVRYQATAIPEPQDAPVEFRQIKTVREFYQQVYEPQKLRGKSDLTKRQYVVQLDHLARFLGREPLFADLRDDVIGQFFASIVEHGNAAATANKARNHVLALWRMAARKRLVANFPDVPRLAEPTRIPRGWLEGDLAKLWAAVASEPGTVAGVPAGPWWTALHHVLWWTGERIGAVLKLRVSDMDFETGWLVVPAQFRKFGLSDKATQLPPVAVEALRAIRQPPRPLLFPWPVSYGLLFSRYKRILVRAGLPADRKSMFHRMRKSSASHFEAAGGNATELLGHSARRVTRNYLDPRIATPPQTATMLFDPSGR